jgi:indolepyruvate ferredoxin oxidoreductase alpha subunit
MKEFLLGDEAVALGALHSGLSAAYGYPGTPSTEILEYLLARHEKGGPLAAWCSNEKTAYEAALGASFAGKRSIVTMKHVGLNVASDPFINSAPLAIRGGLVLAVADDPGQHSSQNEQDTRFYGAFAMVPVLEPRSQQEAYQMTREAFDLSETFQTPVIIRMVTRLAHARAAVTPSPVRAENPLDKAQDRTQWMLLPNYSRKNIARLIETYGKLPAATAPYNRLETEGRDASLAVITSGLGGNYYDENAADFAAARGGKLPVRLHIGAYPVDPALVEKACEKAGQVLVIEEGQPFIEERLVGLLPRKGVKISGRFSGEVQRTGELDPDNVRAALGRITPGLTPRKTIAVTVPPLPGRPPQLCQGCPHGDSFQTIKDALAGLQPQAVTSDIGCYSLGAMPPLEVPETIVCMGASIGMARGAAEAGITYAVATIGDSTFLHSGMTALLDAAAANVPMTVAILDNSIVAMTGCQETIVPSAKLKDLILGLGVDPAHLIELESKKQNLAANVQALRRELEYRGLSVVIFRRECLEALRKWKKLGKKEGE